MVKKILIAVKTYPTLSMKYEELVCTAGFLEDGSWIRIYPVPFRKLDYANQYKKWNWIEVDVKKNSQDHRKESYRPYSIDTEIKIVGEVNTNKAWAERKKIVLQNVYNNLELLLEDKKNKDISLAVLKPSEIIDFVWEEVEREWDPKKLKKCL